MPLLCQASVVARPRSNTVAPKSDRILLPNAGWLLKYHCGSVSAIGRPPSPSNDSRYACCDALVCGRLPASSAEKPILEGTVVGPNGSFETSDVKGSASKLKSALTPTTSVAAGSKPSGGRVKFVRWLCEMAVKLIVPLSNGSSAVAPNIDVGVSSKTGFSSYCTVTCRGRGKRVSGRLNETRPRS